MSRPVGEQPGQARFLADRMLGTLCRYLRFMGYDTVSATGMAEGNTREDTVLLARARAEGRILLTRDRELARRGGHDALLVEERGVMDQLQALARAGLIVPEVRLTRCSLCNTPLRPARPAEVKQAKYAPGRGQARTYYWCVRCRKLYWQGSHGKNLEKGYRSFSAGLGGLERGLLLHLGAALEPDELLSFVTETRHGEHLDARGDVSSLCPLRGHDDEPGFPGAGTGDWAARSWRAFTVSPVTFRSKLTRTWAPSNRPCALRDITKPSPEPVFCAVLICQPSTPGKSRLSSFITKSCMISSFDPMANITR